MEIGSFIELGLIKDREYYKGENVAKLNNGRAGIYHSMRVLGCNTIHLPYYLCDTVRDFLIKRGMTVKYYYIDSKLNPIDLNIINDEAVLFVNYFGVMSKERMKSLSNGYKNVIIDNSQAFFANLLDNCLNVYSVRKFVGVPDGCYVVGENATKYLDEYKQDYSSDTSLFLLQRIEKGCEASYQSRMLNEERVDNSDILKMSKLTHAILDSIDYSTIKTKRIENYAIAKEMFDSINKLKISQYYADDCVPMVYPLLVESDELLPYMQKNKIFQGHWWSYLLDEVSNSTFEYYISRYIIPITIDQRYGREELAFTKKTIEDKLNK